MSAISGTRRSMKELADGTIRVQIDIDPIHRDEFFKLFGQIDMPVAIAPLIADFEQPKEEKPKGGELARLAGMWCKDPRFWEWATQYLCSDEVRNEEQAKKTIHSWCSITSRAQLDSDELSASVFHQLIRIPYSEWLRTNGD